MPILEPWTNDTRIFAGFTVLDMKEKHFTDDLIKKHSIYGSASGDSGGPFFFNGTELYQIGVCSSAYKHEEAKISLLLCFINNFSNLF